MACLRLRRRADHGARKLRKELLATGQVDEAVHRSADAVIEDVVLADGKPISRKRPDRAVYDCGNTTRHGVLDRIVKETDSTSSR